MNKTAHDITSASQGEIVLYQPDETVSLEVKVGYNSVWLTQLQMAELFNASKQNVSLHIRNIYEEGELEEESTVKEYLTVRKDIAGMLPEKISQSLIGQFDQVFAAVTPKAGIGAMVKERSKGI